jgi:hypothetical protein
MHNWKMVTYNISSRIGNINAGEVSLPIDQVIYAKGVAMQTWIRK